jgi:hypothetical protein
MTGAKIYVVISFTEDQMENVFVGTDEDKALGFKPSDFDDCDALFIEIWEDGNKIDDYRLEN